MTLVEAPPTAPAPPPARNIPGPAASLLERLKATTGGVDPFPLGVLATLFFFDEFDTAAFNVLGPQIKLAFGLTQSEFATIVVANLSVVLLLAIPLGHFADRLPRRKLIVAGATLAGVCSLLTGLVPGGIIALLVLVRLGNGVGRLINDPIHTSYLADSYKPADRPRVFAFHRNAPYLGAIFGSALAGIVAAATGSFRAAFVILIIPILATALVALRLPEPRRGATDSDEEPDPFGMTEAPAPFREAVRILFTVKTLKRQFASWLFIGAGLVPLAALLPVYLEKVFGLGPLARGGVTALNAACTFAAIRAAGPWTQRWMAKGLGAPVRRAGAALAGVGVGILLIALVPGGGAISLAAVVVLGAGTSYVAGIFTPPFVTTQALVSPARVRTLSFSFGSLFLVTGVWLLYILPGVAKLADDSVRQGLGATAPFWVIGGLILASAGRFVEGDTMQAINGAALAAQARAAAGAGDTLLSCRGVEVGYDQVQILFGVDLEVHKGEIVALLGTNGAGKSTLLRAITGLTDPMGGSIYFEGNDLTHAEPQAALAAGIVLVPGGRAVFPTLTVAEHLRAAGWLYRDDPAYLAAANEDVLVTFPRLRERYEQLAGDLSGGEQQMLALGMAFIAKPKLLLIDELSLGLAPTIVEQLLGIVRRIRDEGTAIILVEQSINVALTVAERAYFLEKGEVRFEGPTSELLQRDDILRSVFLQGAGENLGGALSTGDAAGSASSFSMGSLGEAPTRAAPEHTGPALEVNGLVMRFGGITAVDNTSFSVNAGEILGLIGANGAGKTTIFDLISGFLTPTSGRVVLNGRDITAATPDARARARLGRSFQDARLIPSLTVAENLALSLERHLEVRGTLAAALGLPGVLRQEEDIAYSVADLVELCGLGAFRDKAARDLSTGSRRIVDLAMCIAHDPAVLLLDEPAAGIAQKEAEALGPLLRRIRDETGCALLLIEHDMPLICGVADRLICLELGAPIAEGTPAEVMADARVQASYLGGDLATINRSGAVAPPLPDGSRPRARRKATPRAITTNTSPAASPDDVVGNDADVTRPSSARTPRRAVRP